MGIYRNQNEEWILSLGPRVDRENKRMFCGKSTTDKIQLKGMLSDYYYLDGANISSQRRYMYILTHATECNMKIILRVIFFS